MIRDVQEEIRLEKYNAEQQVLLEEREAAMRDVQLEETRLVLRDHKSAFTEYVTAAEEEENVRECRPPPLLPYTRNCPIICRFVLSCERIRENYL